MITMMKICLFSKMIWMKNFTMKIRINNNCINTKILNSNLNKKSSNINNLGFSKISQMGSCLGHKAAKRMLINKIGSNSSSLSTLLIRMHLI